MDQSPGVLVVEGVKAKDRGVYRCRVDFKIQPTTISRVDLAVNMPPEKPVILDSRGREVGRRLGPYRLGQILYIIFYISYIIIYYSLGHVVYIIYDYILQVGSDPGCLLLRAWGATFPIGHLVEGEPGGGHLLSEGGVQGHQHPDHSQPDQGPPEHHP